MDKDMKLRKLITTIIREYLNEQRGNSLKKGDIVKYDGDRYIIINIIDDELLIRPLRNPYGGSYHSSPLNYPHLKVKIDNPKLEFFS